MADDFKELGNQFLIDAQRNMTSIMDNCVYLVRGDENTVFGLIESEDILESVRAFMDEDPETAKRILLAALSAVRTAELIDQVSTEIQRRAARN